MSRYHHLLFLLMYFGSTVILKVLFKVHPWLFHLISVTLIGPLFRLVEGFIDVVIVQWRLPPTWSAITTGDWEQIHPFTRITTTEHWPKFSFPPSTTWPKASRPRSTIQYTWNCSMWWNQPLTWANITASTTKALWATCSLLFFLWWSLHKHCGCKGSLSSERQVQLDVGQSNEPGPSLCTDVAGRCQASQSIWSRPGSKGGCCCLQAGWDRSSRCGGCNHDSWRWLPHSLPLFWSSTQYHQLTEDICVASGRWCPFGYQRQGVQG